jgi:hypothetical protein
VEIALSNPDWPQKELDAALERAIDMCPICNALGGTDIQVKFGPA